MTFLIAYQPIHTWFVQNEPFKSSLNNFSGNDFFYYGTEGKNDMSVSVLNQELASMS